jgi:hypothetical protein
VDEGFVLWPSFLLVYLCIHSLVGLAQQDKSQSVLVLVVFPDQSLFLVYSAPEFFTLLMFFPTIYFTFVTDFL